MSHASTQDLISELLESARMGDWARLDELSSRLPNESCPTTDTEMADYMFRLRTVIVTARMTRADILKSLHRLSAASGFNQCG